MGSYFSKKLTGGSHASIGFNYQDLCALSFMFNNAKNPDFLSVTQETIDDFSLIFTSHEVVFQVKKREIDLSLIKEVLNEVSFKENKQMCIIGTSVKKTVENLMWKRDWLLSSLNSSRDEIEKEKIKDDFEDELRKLKLLDYYDELINLTIYPVPEKGAELYLQAFFYEWVKFKDITIDEDNFLNRMLLMIQQTRIKRGEISKEDLNDEINNHIIHKTNEYKKMFDMFYADKIHPSETLKVLGDNNEEILASLEELMKKADTCILDGKYRDALEIYEILSKTFRTTTVLINCAALYEALEEFDKVLTYCDNIMEIDSNNFEAYFLKGTAYASKGELDNAINNYFAAKDIKETHDLNYNLGVAYRQKGLRSKAYQYFEKSLELNNNFHPAHLNISEYFEFDVKFALQHLDKAIELAPNCHKAYGRKGEVLRYIGLNEQAVNNFEKCLELDDKNYGALYGISLSLIDLGRLEESLIHLSKFLRCYKEDLITTGKETVITDLNWHTTRIFSVYGEDEENVVITIGDLKIPISLSLYEGYIFLGLIADESKRPIIFLGKKYKHNKGFEESVKKTINSTKYYSNNQYIDTDGNIKVKIIEYKDKFFISINFYDYKITGFTDSKSINIEQYIDVFNENRNIVFKQESLENKQEFIVLGIEDIEFIDKKNVHVNTNITNDMVDNAMDLNLE